MAWQEVRRNSSSCWFHSALDTRRKIVQLKKYCRDVFARLVTAELFRSPGGWTQQSLCTHLCTKPLVPTTRIPFCYWRLLDLNSDRSSSSDKDGDLTDDDPSSAAATAAEWPPCRLLSHIELDSKPSAGWCLQIWSTITPATALTVGLRDFCAVRNKRWNLEWRERDRALNTAYNPTQKWLQLEWEQHPNTERPWCWACTEHHAH